MQEIGAGLGRMFDMKDEKISQKKVTTEEGDGDGTEIIQKMIKHDRAQYVTKRLLDKAQYHQCIPNPEKPGELITVQLFTPKLKQADPKDSIKDMHGKY